MEIGEYLAYSSLQADSKSSLQLGLQISGHLETTEVHSDEQC